MTNLRKRVSAILLTYLLLFVGLIGMFPTTNTLRVEAYSMEQQELTGNALVDFRYWKQTKRFGQPWAYMYIGGGSVSSLGCYMTSISIGGVVSGAIQTTTDFSPSWTVEEGNKRGWYYGGSLYADKVAAGIGGIENSNYRFVERTDQTGLISRSNRMSYAIEKIKEGYTVIAHVNGGQHFVCLGNITADGNDVEVYDPAKSGITMFSSYLGSFGGDFRLFISDRERMSNGDLDTNTSKGKKNQDSNNDTSVLIQNSAEVGSLGQMSSSEKEALAIALNKYMTSNDLDAVKWNMVITQFTKLYDESVDQTLRGQMFSEFISKHGIELDQTLGEEESDTTGSSVNQQTNVEVWSGMTATEFFRKAMNVDNLTVGIPSSGLDVKWVQDHWGANKFYCDRVGTYRKGVEHHGIDYCIEIGTPVYTPVSGKVTYQGFSSGGGYSLHIRDANDVVHIYYHLRESSYKVAVGDTVKAGDCVAEVGNSGTRNGKAYLAHLHYELADLKIYDSVLAEKRCINGIDPDTYQYPIDSQVSSQSTSTTSTVTTTPTENQNTMTTESQTTTTTTTTESQTTTTNYKSLSSVFSILASKDNNYYTPVFNSSNNVATLHDLFKERVLFVKDNIAVFGGDTTTTTEDSKGDKTDSRRIENATSKLLIEMIKNKTVYASGSYATVTIDNKTIVFETTQNGFFQALLQVMGLEEAVTTVDKAKANKTTIKELFENPEKYSDKNLKELAVNNPNDLRKGDLLTSPDAIAIFDSWTAEGFAKVYEFTVGTFGTTNDFKGDVSYEYNAENNSIKAHETSWTLGGIYTKFFRFENLDTTELVGTAVEETSKDNSVSYWSLLKSQTLGNTMGDLYTLIKKNCDVKEVYSPVFVATDSTVFYNCLFCEIGLQNRNLKDYSTLINSIGNEPLFVDCYGNLCINNGSKGHAIVYPSYANPIYTSSPLGDADIVGNYYENLKDLLSKVSSLTVGITSAETILKNSEIEKVLIANNYSGTSQDLALGVEAPGSEISAFQKHDIKNCLEKAVSATGYRRVYDSTELLADCIDDSKGVSIPVLKLDSSTSYLVSYPVLEALKSKSSDEEAAFNMQSTLKIENPTESVVWNYSSNTNYNTSASSNRVTLRDGSVVSLKYPCTLTNGEAFSGMTLSVSKSFYSASPINSLINGELNTTSRKTYLSGSWSIYNGLGDYNDNSNNLWSAELLWLSLQEDSKKYQLCFNFDSETTLGEQKFNSISNMGLFNKFTYQPVKNLSNTIFVSNYALDLGLDNPRSDMGYNTKYHELGKSLEYNNVSEAIEILGDYWSNKVFSKLPISSFVKDDNKTSSLYPSDTNFNLYSIEDDQNINVISFTSNQDSYEISGGQNIYGQTGQVDYVYINEYGYSVRFSAPHQILSVYKNGYGDNLTRWVDALREWNSSSLSLMDWVNRVMRHPITAFEELLVTLLQIIHNSLRGSNLDQLFSITGLSEEFLKSNSFKTFMILSSLLFIITVFVFLIKSMLMAKRLVIDDVISMIKSFVCLSLVPLLLLNLLAKTLGEINTDMLAPALTSTQIEELKKAQDSKSTIVSTSNNVMVPIESDSFEQKSTVLLLDNGAEVSVTIEDLKNLLCQVKDLNEGKLVCEEGIGEESTELDDSTTTPVTTIATPVTTIATPMTTTTATIITTEGDTTTTTERKVDKLVNDNPLLAKEIDIATLKGQSSYLWYNNSKFTPVNFDNYDLSVFFYFYDWITYQYLNYENSKGSKLAAKFNTDAESFSTYTATMSDADLELSKTSGEFNRMYQDSDYLYSYEGLYCKDLLGLSELFKMVNSKGEATEYSKPDDYYLDNKESILKWAEVSKFAYYNSRGTYDDMKSGGSSWISDLGTKYPINNEVLDDVTIDYDNSVEFYPMSLLTLGDYWEYYDSALCLSSSSLQNQIESTYSYHQLDSYIFSPDYIQRLFTKRFSGLNLDTWTSKTDSLSIESNTRVPWRTYGAFGAFSNYCENVKRISKEATKLEVRCNQVNESYLEQVGDLLKIMDSKGLIEKFSDRDLILIAALIGTFEFNKEFDTFVNTNPTISVALNSVSLEALCRSLLELPENSANTGLIFEVYHHDGSVFTTLFLVLTELLSVLIAIVRLAVLALILLLTIVVIGTEELTSKGGYKIRYFGLGFTIVGVVAIQLLQVFAYRCCLEISINNLENRNLIEFLCLMLFSYACFMWQCRLLYCLIKEPYTFGGSLHLHKIKQTLKKFIGEGKDSKREGRHKERTTFYNKGTLQDSNNSNDVNLASTNIEFVNNLIDSDEDSEHKES